MRGKCIVENLNGGYTINKPKGLSVARFGHGFMGRRHDERCRCEKCRDVVVKKSLLDGLCQECRGETICQE